MGKVAIIGFHNLHLMQFLYKYTQILDLNDIDYDVLYWNRDDVAYPKKFNGNAICYHYPTSNYVSKWKKLHGYLKCRRFFINTIKKNHYDRIILLTTQTAIALSTIALRKYKGKYVYDFRDLTMEHIPCYRWFVEKLILYSSFTAISSEGFIPIIAKKSYDFVLSHNCSCLEVHPHIQKKQHPINIVFWGMLRQISYQKKICDYFANDERFCLMYHGEGATAELQEYCAKKGYSNIFFTGRYFPEEIEGFAKRTDILMNLYENEGKQEHALTVKLYDAVRYSLPMLVTAESYMAKYIGSRPFAYTFSFSPEDKESILKWYAELETIDQGFSDFSDRVNQDDWYFKEKLLNFVNV